MKLIRKTDQEGDFVHWCSGCKCMHLINTGRKNANGAQWSFNGNYEKPTFHPSINIENGYCHYTITDGVVFYHDATGHDLGGKSILLEDTDQYF